MTSLNVITVNGTDYATPGTHSLYAAANGLQRSPITFEAEKNHTRVFAAGTGRQVASFALRHLDGTKCALVIRDADHNEIHSIEYATQPKRERYSYDAAAFLIPMFIEQA